MGKMHMSRFPSSGDRLLNPRSLIDKVWKGERLEPETELDAAEVVTADGFRGPELRDKDSDSRARSDDSALETTRFSRRSKTGSI